jgi:long-chain acyl-CoA synthetase
MNILVLLQMAAEAMPDRHAFYCNGESLTYSQLYSASGRAAEYFLNSQCEYVSLLDTSSLATPIALFGAAAAGKPYVRLNYRLTGA